MTNLAVIRETNLRDVPGTLRALAATIEAGEAAATGCAIVWETDILNISYCGDGEAGPRAHLLFTAAAHLMVRAAIDGQ